MAGWLFRVIPMARVFKLTPLIPSESNESRAFIRWARYSKRKHPELEMIYHIPNGGLRDIQTGARLKKEGVKPGMPDYHLPVARGGYHSLYIEMKIIEGGKLSDVQEKVITQLLKYGNKVVVCYGWEQAKKAVLDYLALEHEACEE